jgi:transposase
MRRQRGVHLPWYSFAAFAGYCALFWDRTGLVLVHKRLEGCKFVWPKIADGVMRMSPAMFAALFEGLDWRLVRPEEARRPQASG